MLTRRHFITSAVGLASVGTGTAGYAVGIEPSWIRQTRWTPRPTAWTLRQPLRIVGIADIHLTSSPT